MEDAKNCSNHGLMTIQASFRHALIDFNAECLTAQILGAIKMVAIGEPRTTKFPTEDGIGGPGYTMVQILADSFLCWDVWFDVPASYLFIASCKPFDPECVLELLREWGLEPHQFVVGGLSV